MIVCGIDPGPEDGATSWACYDTDARRVVGYGTDETRFVIERLKIGHPEAGAYVVERLDSYLRRAGREVFSAQWAAGRLYQAAGGRGRCLRRKDVKLTLLGTATGNDADVRGKLIDRFGPGRRAAVGLKKSPGPLYGLKGGEWQALAVAVAWWDRRSPKP